MHSPCLCGDSHKQLNPVFHALFVSWRQGLLMPSSFAFLWDVPDAPCLQTCSSLKKLHFPSFLGLVPFAGCPFLFFADEIASIHPSIPILAGISFGLEKVSPLHVSPSLKLGSVQFSSVAQSCPTLCNPVNRSTPGFPVHHQLLEFTQTRVVKKEIYDTGEENIFGVKMEHFNSVNSWQTFGKQRWWG